MACCTCDISAEGRPSESSSPVYSLFFYYPFLTVSLASKQPAFWTDKTNKSKQIMFVNCIPICQLVSVRSGSVLRSEFQI